MKTRIIIILLLAANCLYAQDKPKGSFGIHVDQDFLASFVTNEDRNYTQGTSFSWTQQDQHKSNFIFLPLNLFYRLGDRFNPRAKDATFVQELPSTMLFGVCAFTPLELRSHIPNYGDRPYSSVLFLETKRARNVGRNFHSWSFAYSLMGTNIGSGFQAFAHRDLAEGRGIPMGWHTQISQGGSFAWLVSNVFKAPLRRKKYDEAIVDNVKKSRIAWDASYGTEAAMGYYTYFGAGVGLRAGYINFKNYRANKTYFASPGDKRLTMKRVEVSDSVPENGGNIADEFSVTCEETRERRWEHFLFANFTPRLWANNNLIQGQPHRPSIYALESKYVSSVVAEIELGYMATRTTYITEADCSQRNGENVQLSVSLKMRSPEYVYPGYTRWHAWLALNFVFPIGPGKP